MNPYQPGQDIFGTSADTRFNSFSDTSALAMNQHNGNWGVNPNLLTPSYTAAYRPTYNGTQGHAFGAPAPTFGGSVNQIFNPFAGGGTNYGGNTYAQQSPFATSIVNNPMDGAANFAQKWVIPGVASWASYKFLSKPLGEGANRFAAGMATGLARGSFSAAQTATIGRVAGGVAGVAGSLFLPLLAAEGAAHAVDKAVFDPYVAQRQMTNDFRSNFAGVTFSDGSGNRVTGKGFSREAAGRQSGLISQMAAKDFSFNQSEFANMTDLASRSGLLDTVQGGQMADRMKLIAKQVKTVMAIGNTSDFKEAIETISKLQMSGVNIKDVSAVYSKLGGLASVAGTSVQKIMSTVGAQGEYLFAANGINPYAGQLTAANAYSSFSAANRNGLISRGALARLGGVDGATQSATSGLLNMASTPYASMSAMNKYLGGGDAGDVVGNVSKFGGFVAQDALNNTGLFNMRRAELAGRSLEEGGLSGQMDQLMKIAKVTPSALRKDGSIKGGAAYQILTQRMNLSDQEAKSIMEQQRFAQDPANLRSTLDGLSGSYEEQRLKRLEQDGRVGSLNVIGRPIVELGHDIQSAGANWVEQGFINPMNKIGDTLEKWNIEITAGKNSNPFAKEAVDSLGIDFEDFDKKANFSKDTQKELISVLKKGGSQEEIAAIIAKSAQKGEIDPYYLSKEGLQKISRAVKRGGVDTAAAVVGKTNEELTGIPDKIKADALVEMAEKVGTEGLSTETLSKLSEITGEDYSIYDSGKALKKLTDVNNAVAGRTEKGSLGKFMDHFRRDDPARDFAESLEARKSRDEIDKLSEETKDASGKKIIDYTNVGISAKGDTNITSQGTVNIYVQGNNLRDGNTGSTYVRG